MPSGTIATILTALCSSAMLVACAGDLKEPKRFGLGDGGSPMTLPAPPSCVTDLFSMKCGSSICHGVGSSQVDLTSAGVQNRIVNHMSSDKLFCKGRTYITTDGSPSLLLGKISSTPPCGQQMPVGGSVTSDEEKCVADWAKALSGGGSADDAGSIASPDGGN